METNKTYKIFSCKNTDFRIGLIRELPFGGYSEFWFIPTVSYYKQDIPKLNEEFPDKTEIRGIKITLIGEYFILIEINRKIR